jgi:hypothetical protein
MEKDISERYNDGLVPAPKLDGDPKRLRPPAWLPSAAQVKYARGRLKLNLLIITAIVILIGSIADWLTR